MIDTILIILAGLSLIAVIFFLTQYGLRIRQMNLKEEQEQRNLDHQNKLINGYKFYEYKGNRTWIERNEYRSDYGKKKIEYIEDSGYFKSIEDLERYLIADRITLSWSREL